MIAAFSPISFLLGVVALGICMIVACAVILVGLRRRQSETAVRQRLQDVVDRETSW